MIDPRSWITRAKCRGADPELFDLSARAYAEHREEVAQALCSGCPVIRECAMDAMDPLAVGTVRAGLWIPLIAMEGARGREQVRRLAVVAGIGAGRG